MIVVKQDDKILFSNCKNKNIITLKKYPVLEVETFVVKGETNQFITVVDEQQNLYRFDRQNESFFTSKLSDEEIINRYLELHPLEAKIYVLEYLNSVSFYFLKNEEYTEGQVKLNFKILDKLELVAEENLLVKHIFAAYFNVENNDYNWKKNVIRFTKFYLKILQNQAKEQGLCIGEMKQKTNDYQSKKSKQTFFDEEEAVMRSFRNGTNDKFGY